MNPGQGRRRSATIGGIADPDDLSRNPDVPRPPKLPDVESPPPEEVLDEVPPKEELVKRARPADEIVEEQPASTSFSTATVSAARPPRSARVLAGLGGHCYSRPAGD
jgi:hypothetical protein